MRQAWSSDIASYDGDFVSFSDVYSRPQPVNRHVPIVVGGHSTRAARRAGELGDGFFPGRGNPQELSILFDHARMCAEKCGRDPEALEFTAGGPTTADYVEQLAEIGVTRMIVPPMAPAQFAEFGEEVIASSRRCEVIMSGRDWTACWRGLMLLLRLITAHNATAELSSVGFNRFGPDEKWEESDRVVVSWGGVVIATVWFATDRQIAFPDSRGTYRQPKSQD